MKSFPLDDIRRPIGGGEAFWVERILRQNDDDDDWLVDLRFQRPEWLLARRGIREPRRLWALRFPAGGFIVAVAAQFPQVAEASGSSVPVRSQTLRLDRRSFPPSLDFSSREFLDGAELLLIESEFVGRIAKDFEVTDFQFPSETIVYGSGITASRRFPGPVVERMKESLRVLPEEFSETEARRFFYRIAQLGRSSIAFSRLTPKPEGAPAYQDGIPVDIKGLVESVPEKHRPLAREIVIADREVAPALGRDFWRDSDRDWVMENLHGNPELQKIAARKGWLAEAPEAVRRVIRKRGWITQELIDAGIELGIEEAMRRETQRFYSLLMFQPDQPARRFPECEAEVRAEIEEKWRSEWERNRWKMLLPLMAPLKTGAALGRLGDEALLRETLEAYVKYGEEIPARYQLINQQDPWPVFQAAFGEKKSDPDFERARRWLESEWKYEPESLTWRLMEP